MNMEQAFLAAISEHPEEETTWLVLADWLEERGDPRGELLRLTRRLMRPGGADRPAREERLRQLLAAGVRPCWPVLTNSIGMQFALIPAGTFLMGSPTDEDCHLEDEQQHEVEITRPFWLGTYPVTQAEYERVMGTNPSYFSASGGGKERVRDLDTGRFPVEQVSWEEAAAFCWRLSELPEEVRQGRVYRLPMEAEWEYSCRGRACSPTPFCHGASLSSTHENFSGYNPFSPIVEGPDLGRTTPVGSYAVNAFGLFDMHGNVREWCSDWYGAEYYTRSPRQDPTGPSEGSGRVERGGCWQDPGWECRSASRGWKEPASRNFLLGFRVALVLSGR
jgi:uncharacterized protein (TIGR02996 family)